MKPQRLSWSDMVIAFYDFIILLWPEWYHFTKSVCHPPDTLPQTAELYYLRVIHKDIDVDTKLSDIPVKDFRIGGFKHDFSWREFFHDDANDISTPRAYILRDAFGFDHQTLDTRVEEPTAHID